MAKLKYKDTIYQCYLDLALDIVNGKWKGLVLWHLSKGTLRNSKIMKLMPRITQKMLTQTLRNLEEDGLISRKVYPVIPPKVEYTLTKRGEKLQPILKMLYQWGVESRNELGVEVLSLDDKCIL